MGAPNLTEHQPILAVQTRSGETPETIAFLEEAGQTFNQGVPGQLAAGYLQQWDGATVDAGIVGIIQAAGQNLPTSGAGAPGPFEQIGPPGSTVTFGKVPYETSAVNIPIGGPATDGRNLVCTGNTETTFEAIFDNSDGTDAASYTPTQADIAGGVFGLTIDANGFWYVDANKTTGGTNTVVQLVGVNPIDGLIVNARVRFKFQTAAIQLL